MKRFSRVWMVAAAAVVTLAFVGTSGAAGPKTLKTFGTAEVSVAGTSATIVVDPGEYGGVYYNSKSQGGKLLANTIFAFTSRGDVEGGAPRWSIPINDGAFDVNQDYAFIDASRCGATVGDNPTNQATAVSTQNPYCHVNWHGVEYDNWATFAFGHPGYTVMKAYLPFIIADSPLDPNGTPATATYVVTDIFAG